ncbi:hypothetical protein ScPMuIL_002814 [Solemya velum]
MAADWNIPILTPVGTSGSLSDKTDFNTLTRMSYNHKMLTEFNRMSLLYFNWTDVAYIYDKTDHMFVFKVDETAATLKNSAITLTRVSCDPSLGEKARRQALVEASQVSRVIVVAGRGSFFRDLMLTAHAMGKTGGDYVFIISRLFEGDTTGDFTWQYNDEDDETARKAFESVLMVQVRVPPGAKFKAFNDEVKTRSLRDYDFDWGDTPVHIMATACVDILLLYATVLNETLNAGDNPLKGREMQNRFWDRHFEGVAGPVAINAVGDRRTDMSLLDLTDPSSPDFQEVAYYDGYTGKFMIVPGVDIHWPNDHGPPANVPECGFKGDDPKCQKYEMPMVSILGAVFACVLLLVGCVGACVYRKFRLEAQLHSLWWKVKWEDIVQSGQGAKSRSFPSTIQVTVYNCNNSLTQVFANTAIYKGVTVVIRKLKIKHLSMDKSTIKELLKMRDINSGHLTKFYGLCPDEPNVCALIEYCSRGSLQDILLNDSIKLDRDFKISLVYDILEGMLYIHNGPLQLHGRLNSSNCVIDSRFVLKITDFGTFSLRKQEKQSASKKRNLLWVAPEHLRTDPYTDFSQADIVQTVRKGTSPPLRPTCSLLTESEEPKVLRLMKICWEESHTKRPSFTEIRRQLRDAKWAISGGNVVDTMMKRMEQYANNLEGLVEERTLAFLDEKRKSEELLYHILPRSVADKLKNGIVMEPEAFESVTIYFSDIIGFTSISARSTPMQVIDLLNDLYTCFDATIDSFDVYKVETIGDAYMVVSGLPIRNGTQHATQIARMSLSILFNLRQFKLRHEPGTAIKVRIGLHSGPVCAGVVGTKMPRYCLFGDTVNTASRMESNGEALKIHASHSTKILLEASGTFEIEKRGDLEIKGKGTMTTYWIMGENI